MPLSLFNTKPSFSGCLNLVFLVSMLYELVTITVLRLSLYPTGILFGESFYMLLIEFTRTNGFSSSDLWSYAALELRWTSSMTIVFRAFCCSLFNFCRSCFNASNYLRDAPSSFSFLFSSICDSSLAIVSANWFCSSASF